MIKLITAFITTALLSLVVGCSGGSGLEEGVHYTKLNDTTLDYYGDDIVLLVTQKKSEKNASIAKAILDKYKDRVRVVTYFEFDFVDNVISNLAMESGSSATISDMQMTLQAVSTPLLLKKNPSYENVEFYWEVIDDAFYKGLVNDEYFMRERGSVALDNFYVKIDEIMTHEWLGKDKSVKDLSTNLKNLVPLVDFMKHDENAWMKNSNNLAPVIIIDDEIVVKTGEKTPEEVISTIEKLI